FAADIAGAGVLVRRHVAIHDADVIQHLQAMDMDAETAVFDVVSVAPIRPVLHAAVPAEVRPRAIRAEAPGSRLTRIGGTRCGVWVVDDKPPTTGDEIRGRYPRAGGGCDCQDQ